MHVLILDGSPRVDGNTTTAIHELVQTFEKSKISTEVIKVGNQAVRGCIACRHCATNHKCVFDDLVNVIALKFQQADALIVASPVYYANANGTLLSFLQRLFCSTGHIDKTMKLGASVAICRRGGASTTFDELNKFFTISNMPVVSSQYWNSVHGEKPGDAKSDLEGLQTMRTLAKNMIFLMNSIALGREKYGLPEKEPVVRTNFI